jgi:two-component system, sensor histidine kinase
MARSRPEQKQKSAEQAVQRPSLARASSIAFAAFAHDIRTSLTGILALGELLASSNIGERERRWAAGIKTSAEHLAALTALVVDGAKAETGSLILQQEVFRPRRLVEVLAESLEARAQNKGLDAEVSVADDLPELLVGDAVRLRAALENLIDNAVKFTARGTVRLEAGATRVKDGRVNLSLTVSDSGIGLTQGEIKRLFRPFAQASADIARRYGGAGLGLAVVKSLAKLMGGDLTVTSTPGSGSRFCFTAELPLASAEVVRETRAQQLLSTPARRLAILCAEDNPYGRVILNTILTELGHRADFVNSGEEAVDAAPRGYDLVLMDVTLPGIGGLEAARRIRALPEATGAIPIIGISGRTEAGDEQAARAAGMNFYLRKPISPSGLSEALMSVTAASSAAEAVAD